MITSRLMDGNTPQIYRTQRQRPIALLADISVRKPRRLHALLAEVVVLR